MIHCIYDLCLTPQSRDQLVDQHSPVVLQDLIGQWEGHVTEHEQYEANYNECSHWLNELQRRLNRCSDASGDRHDIENMQAKLQVRHFTFSFLCHPSVILIIITLFLNVALFKLLNANQSASH